MVDNFADRNGRPGVSLPEHLAIIDAVCAHDPEAAEQAARAHLRSVIKTLLTLPAAGDRPASRRPPGRTATG
ncbi:FCD domain-containing protein [Nonomuraea sediminis]|uniref:FCD domain-containing protein n=1 Tax=Nonomuraea sediminis TaxID=2835864 RepID=UPI001BDC65AA|nr:FCD domain-containing protein [Nonomuraea sediminis]